ncbi:hypothetical protein ATCV1_z326R [Acanthocystis turfacea chlorella virus 1]|uniref:Uncharacterized protein z326R n=1 Tax=Chlorovirus heliozoae TaxID=322019 RepID=A7K8T6_9PHYC|nr:hypothetical protein ATCV1_z326R [Acanthocystis turfacea chlorella virus 1]ABT16460.1 hypothetical protein ATCV1_z326R [Acanthocystis turfacea chlorella virus 1]
MSQRAARKGGDHRPQGSRGGRACRVQEEQDLDEQRNKAVKSEAVPEEAWIFRILRQHLLHHEHGHGSSGNQTQPES